MTSVITSEETRVTERPVSTWRKAEPVIRRVLILAILFGQIAYHFSRANSYQDPDLWWHLATARWMVENQTVPTNDPFSEYGQDRPWVAYTWLFDLVVFKFHAKFGLLGIEYLKTITALILGLVLYCLLQKLVGSFGFGALLTAVALAACLPLATPRPWLFTILLFAAELALLTRLRNNEGKEAIWAVPLIFALWANVHIQLVYGLILIGIFMMEGLQEKWWRGYERYTGRWTSLRRYALILLLSGAAVCLNPYGASVYSTIWELANQGGIYLLIQDLSPPNFRSPTHWVFLALALGAVYVTGRRRTRSVLPYLLLFFGVVSALRMQRDVWMAALAGAAVLAGWPSGRTIGDRDLDWVPGFKTVLTVAIAALIVVPVVWNQNERELQQQVSQHFPTGAVRYIASQPDYGPLFNDFGWGGYLTWALPATKVSIDGRTHVHSARRVMRSYLTWSGSADWASDPDLQKAGMVLAPRGVALVSILRLDPRYRVVYEDKVAVVFRRYGDTPPGGR